MSFVEQFINGFEIFSGVYSILYLLLYFILGYLSFRAIERHYKKKYYLSKEVIIKSRESVGISIIAPAFNEENTIVYNVKSLLSQSYPKYEVIIINDGSADSTLVKLIDEFELIKVNFFYQEKLQTQQVRGHYKSTNPIYSKLLVVDKINGKSKADASNAGINSSKYGILLCTDVDCILRRDTLATLIKPFIENTTKTIATGAPIRISNSCEFKDGLLYKSHFPNNFFARFQELEYIRSFLFGRMAWGEINSLLLVSGGLGMFDKDTVIEAGGYWHKSIGEDLDLVIRMRKVMHDKNEKFLIQYVPESLCWTEVPSTKEIFFRQRVRWTRGLIQTLVLHRKLFFNPKYGSTGLIALPYFFFCEFLVPILEVLGLICIVFDIYLFGINYNFLLVISTFIYLFYIANTLFSVRIDQLYQKQYASIQEILKLIVSVFIEPFVYHPFTVYSALKGYANYFIKSDLKWGEMTRQGFNKAD